MLRFRPLRSILLLLSLVPTVLPAADEASVSAAKQAENNAAYDQAMAGPKYEFTVVDAGTVLDPSDKAVAVRNLKKHLKKGKYDKKAAIVLAFEADAEMPDTSRMADLVMAFESYGMSTFVLRRKPKIVTSADGTRTLVIDPKTNSQSLTANDPQPAYADRPVELRPGELSSRVRYKPATDEVVIGAAARIQSRLLAATPGDGALFGDVVLVGCGAWQYFRNEPDIGHKDSKPVTGRIPTNKKVVQLDGRLLQDAGEIATLEQKLRAMIQHDGGGTVRALRTDEMDKWWAYISFDIEEPVFAVESKGGRYLFIVSFGKEGAFELDELHGLPTL
jgi:hypothetical protein